MCVMEIAVTRKKAVHIWISKKKTSGNTYLILNTIEACVLRWTYNTAM